jgi:hypothetical protein
MVCLEILAATAQGPNGPWSDAVTVFTGNTIYYVPVAQGHFDTSGKTLTFDMAIFSPIYLQTVKLVGLHNPSFRSPIADRDDFWTFN